MTTKILAGTSSSGYRLHAPTTTLSIASSGYVGGVYAPMADTGAYTIVNAGRCGYPFYSQGIYLSHGGAVTNFGTVDGGYGGVALNAGGGVTNGSATDTGALIQGGDRLGPSVGISISGAGAVTNFGAIAGDGDWGVDLAAGGSVTNGSARDKTAQIEGGVSITGAGTVTNFGTITSTGGTSVKFGSTKDVLVVEAGSKFTGAIQGDEGTLDLASGVGTLTGLFSGGDVTVSGSMPTTTFSGFGALQIGAGASFTDSGDSTIGTGHSLIDEGTLIDQGTLTFTRDDNSFSGTLRGAGTVAFVGGSDAFTGATLSAAGMDVAKAVVTLDGVIDLTGKLTATTPGMIIAAGGATLAGGGLLDLSDLATNHVEADTAASLTNLDDIIVGAGQIGSAYLTLTNAAGGVIDGDDSLALVIGSGRNTIVNAGVIGSSGRGGTVIESDIDNTGVLWAGKGNLTVEGAVTGGGLARVNGATLDFTSGFSQEVIFGPTGELELAHAQDYAGRLVGFSTAGTTSLNLRDIGFKSAGEATFSGTSTGGVLTVTDGTHTAHITLTGDYLGSTFTASSDGHGGTIVLDPSKAAAARPAPGAPVNRFIAAAAGLAPRASGAISIGGQTWHTPPPTLSRPRTQIA